MATTSALNHISQKLAVMVSVLGSALLALERISEWEEKLVENENDPKEAENVAATEELFNSFRMFDEKIVSHRLLSRS